MSFFEHTFKKFRIINFNQFKIKLILDVSHGINSTIHFLNHLIGCLSRDS
ncbi:MAG: CRISPR-associated DxTHG motif protein [Halobacteriovoraceae bacterium]|nr:CRISPR-associated DxTHG motif protein [Halobacteriovoraceae bacterium]